MQPLVNLSHQEALLEEVSLSMPRNASSCSLMSFWIEKSWQIQHTLSLGAFKSLTLPDFGRHIHLKSLRANHHPSVPWLCLHLDFGVLTQD